MSRSVGWNGLWNGHLKGLFLVESSGGSRRSGKGGGGGGGYPDPELREARSPKNFFLPFGPQFGLKIRGGGGPGLLP